MSRLRPLSGPDEPRWPAHHRRPSGLGRRVDPPRERRDPSLLRRPRPRRKQYPTRVKRDPNDRGARHDPGCISGSISRHLDSRPGTNGSDGTRRNTPPRSCKAEFEPHCRLRDSGDRRTRFVASVGRLLLVGRTSIGQNHTSWVRVPFGVRRRVQRGRLDRLERDGGLGPFPAGVDSARLEEHVVGDARDWILLRCAVASPRLWITMLSIGTPSPGRRSTSAERSARFARTRWIR